ncbi:hypothetical protein [Alkalihalobacterium bogoriense]|uniref:hypothetical protein n=1 Tax=Alkalihalobacterium bogoriense TaxID=246272 RepID=UPI000688E9B5|nr:hypothetical protein [Alkalihalobacterium bogoriense]
MAIREVISYNKDLLTGDLFTLLKNKENTGIKGKVLIEVFDAQTHEKVKEAYTENIIPDLIFKDMFLRYFAGEVMGIGNTNHNHTKNLFNNIFLTDSTKAEMAGTEKVFGNVVGYAHRNSTYSGQDPLRGTINLAESKLEIRNNKIRVNFVFDFPTHAANGEFESIFWSDAFSALNECYIGPPIFGKGTDSGDGYVNAITTGTGTQRAIFWTVSHAMSIYSPSKFRLFTDFHKGFVCFDGTNSTSVNSTLIQFPEHLKGHQLLLPFDLNRFETGFIDWNNAVILLSESGQSFTANQLTAAFPILKDDGDIDYIFGYHQSGNLLRLYRWSRVGVLQSSVTIDNMATEFQDEYGANFTYRDIAITPLFWGNPIEVYGHNNRTDPSFNETVYSSRVIRLNVNGTKHSELHLKPRIGGSTWFASRGMNSGNIDRRCYLSSINRTRNRVYLYYVGVNGGSSFYQVITPEGNVLEAYRTTGITSEFYNIRGTDKWLYMYRDYNTGTGWQRYHFGIHYAGTSRPSGAHTKLANPVQKTDANTMKVQYMFEIDLVTYTNDIY